MAVGGGLAWFIVQGVAGVCGDDVVHIALCTLYVIPDGLTVLLGSLLHSVTYFNNSTGL